MARVQDEINHFCFPCPDKRSPLALAGYKAAKTERALRAPFVPTEASFVGHKCCSGSPGCLCHCYKSVWVGVPPVHCCDASKLPGWPGTAVNSFRVALPTGLWSLQALNSENQQFILMTSLPSGSMWPRGCGLPVGQMTCGETSWVPGASILGVGSDGTRQDSLLVAALGACV